MIELFGLTPATLALAFAVAVLAGTVKGAIGFAMPMVLISGLSTVMDPRIALAGMILPTLVSNLMQVARVGFGPALAEARVYWRYLLVVCVLMVLIAQGVAALPGRAFYGLLGLAILLLSLMQLAGWRPQIAPEGRRRAEWIAGLVSGVLGGIAGAWGPITVLFLTAIDAPRARSMVVQGVIYGLGSVFLLLGHLQSGLFNRDTAPLSAALIVPAALGMWIGFRLHDRMDAARFRTATLIFLTIAALNFIRRALWG